MLPIQTILHPTDFSEHSNYALRLACSLAKDYRSRLIALHVLVRPVIAYGEGVIPPDPETLYDDAWKRLNDLQVPDRDHAVDRRLSEAADAAEEIVRFAREVNADLIVMGTHGRTGIGRLLMGSVAEHVLRGAECPVLTVRTPFHEGASKTEEPLLEAVG
jgi:nucleotide-binding universal stress UspA family protein